MCKIVLSALLLFSFNSFSYTKLSLDMVNESRNEALQLAQTDLYNQLDTQTFQLSADIYELVPKLELQVGLTRTEISPQNVYINLENNISVPIGNESSVFNNSFQLSSTYTIDDLSYSANISMPLNKEYFYSRSYGLGIEKSFYNRSTLVGATFSNNRMWSPQSYFTDPVTFKKKQTPLINSNNYYSLYLDQTLSQKDKMRVTFGHQEKNKIRPAHYLAALKYGHAFENGFFVKLGHSYVFEEKSDALFDSTGYLNNHNTSVEVSYEVNYDLLVSASYDLIVENGEDPRFDSEFRVGVDQYGLGLSYELSDYLLNIQASLVNSNTDVNIVNVSGGVSWTL